MPISYDANDADWDTTQPIGTAVLANCPCGSTLALTTEDLPLAMRLELLNWIRIEIQRKGVDPSELLEYLRDEIHKRVFAGLI